MKRVTSIIVLGMTLAFGNAFAASNAAADAAPVKAKTKQQVKMAACNKDAKEKALKGDSRKKFMSSCLSA